MTVADPIVHAFDGLASRVDATGFRTVGFTSALLGEGVSTIALGTALALAALRQEKVLLVDANWIQPSLTVDAHLEGTPGLADHLANGADLMAVVRPALRSHLAFLPIGDRTGTRPTLRALAAFLARDVAAFQTVVVDLPPILVGEAFLLPWTTLLDQLFVVLREAATPLKLVRQALDRIDLVAPPHIVLNRTTAPLVDLSATLRAART